MAGDFVDGGEDAAHAGVGGGDFEVDGKGGGHDLEDFVFASSEDGVVGSAHAQVGDEGGAVAGGVVGGDDFLIGGGGVGVGADADGDAAGDVPAHGDFFAGDFGVEFEDFDFDFGGDLGEERVDGAEGVVHLRVHVEAAHDAQDGDLDAGLGGEDGEAFAGGGGGVVDRADKLRGFEDGEDFAFSEGVVAEGAAVDAGLEDFFEDGGREAGATGGVFGVGDDEVDGVVFDGDGEEFLDGEAAGFADDVSEAEDLDGHGSILSSPENAGRSTLGPMADMISEAGIASRVSHVHH